MVDHGMVIARIRWLPSVRLLPTTPQPYRYSAYPERVLGTVVVDTAYT